MKERQQIPIEHNSANVPSGVPVPFDLFVEFETGTSGNVVINTSPFTMYVSVTFTNAPQLWSMKFTTPQDAFTVQDGTGAFKRVWVEYDVADEHLITPVDVSALARPVYSDEKKVERFIAESENADIRRKIGDGLWSWIFDVANINDARREIVMDGGTWTDCRGNLRTCVGLRVAAAYYVYSRIVTQGNVDMTRVGTINRTSDNTTRSDWNERLQVSRETAAIAQTYVDEVMAYVENDAELRAIAHPRRNDAYRTRIQTIGQ